MRQSGGMKQPSGSPGLGWVKEYGRADSVLCLRASVLGSPSSHCKAREGGEQQRDGESEAYKHDSDVISRFWVLNDDLAARIEGNKQAASGCSDEQLAR